MDCTVLMPGAQRALSSYRVRWGATGTTRLDTDSTGREQRTLLIPDEAVSTALYANIAARATATARVHHDPVWQPALEFLTPAMLVQHMETQYGWIQAEDRSGAGQDEFLLVGQQEQQAVEIAVDARTYLPITLKKYPLDSNRTGGARTCLEEVRFQWNKPIPRELFTPKSPAGDTQVNH
jgi:hypothetical protein